VITKLRQLLGLSSRTAALEDDPEEKLRLAVAVLLVEIARADFDETAVERDSIVRLLAGFFGLEKNDAATLLVDAGVVVDEAVSLHDYTRAVHTKMDETEKHDVISMLWRVALADERVDKYEDYLIKKMADLMHVSHSDVIRIKHEVMENP